MNDYAKMFKAFVCPYLAVAFGSAIAFNFATGQTVEPLLWTIWGAMMAELGFEFGALPVVKKLKKKQQGGE